MIRSSSRMFSTATALILALLCQYPVRASTGVRMDVRSMGAKGDGLTDDTAAINAAITEAIKDGPGSTVFLPSGTYRIGTPTSGSKSLEVIGASGLTIMGEAGTKIVADAGATAFDLRNCQNLTVSHLVVDRDPLLYTQGTVIAVDPARLTCDVAIEKGYQNLDSPQFAGTVRFLPFIYPGRDDYQQDRYIPDVQSLEQLSPGVWRIHLQRNGVIEDWINKPCLIKSRETGWCFTGSTLDNWTVDHVEYWGGGGQAAWYLRNLTGTTTFNAFMVRVPPGTDRLYCCAGGGQINNLRGRLIIENSEFTRIDDDGLDVLASWQRVTAQDNPRTIHVQQGSYQVGDHIEIWDWVKKTSYAEAIVTAALPSPGGDQILTLDRDVHCNQVGAGVGQAFGRAADADGIDRVIDLDSTGTQTVVRNCVYQDFRAKCLNLKAQNCTVEDCTFYDSWQSPISASPEWYFEEGPNVHNLVVRNNTFTNCVHSNIEVGTVAKAQMTQPNADPDPAQHPELYGHETMNVLIEGNKFNDYGAHSSDYPFVPIGDAIRVVNTANVTIDGNDFGSPAPTAPSSPKLIVVGCTNVKIDENKNMDPSEIDQK